MARDFFISGYALTVSPNPESGEDSPHARDFAHSVVPVLLVPTFDPEIGSHDVLLVST